MFRGGSFINKDEILFRMADKQILHLLKQSLMLRSRYALMNEDDLLIDIARDLEGAAISIAADCSERRLIPWDEYRVIRNIIDHIGTGERMEDIVW